MRERFAVITVFMLVGCSSSPHVHTSPPDSPTCEAPTTPTEPGLVATDSGIVRGASAGGTWSYLGIPYAAPPVDALRWQPPHPAACWDGVRDATGFGYECVQLDSADNPVGSEDCLTLNVWTPKNRSAALPVLVFIHGGAGVVGSSSLKIGGVEVYGGQYLAEHDQAVVVTLNYRLGPLGYAAHRALTAQDPDDIAGNYGTLDMIEALKWVQRNIAAFGGDPKRVMVFGQSFGAFAVCALLTTPRAQGLFGAAAMLSGGCAAHTLDRSEAIGDALATALGCDAATDIAACMRQKSPAEVVAALPRGYAIGAVSYGPTIDGVVFPEPPLQRILAGRHNHVPLLIGTTADEMETFIYQFITTPVVTATDYRAALVRTFGAQMAPIVEQIYPVANFTTPFDALKAVLADVNFICPSRKAARAAAAGQSETVRRYVWAHGFSGGPLAQYKANHGWDNLFVFHALDLYGYTPTADELALADRMAGYFTRFAATGDPNGGGAAILPPYDVPTDRYLAIDVTSTVQQGIDSAQCDFWEPYL
jgi:para-nitrobenzyl esterase